MRDLRVGSQTFANGNANPRYLDESSDLTSTWSNTQHVLELDIPADASNFLIIHLNQRPSGYEPDCYRAALMS